MKHNHWFWGVFFIAAAVFVIASQLTSFVHIGFWSIAAAVLLAALFIQSLVTLNYFGIFLPLALGYLIFQHPLGLVIISGWLLILAAIFVSIGFHIIFRSRPKWAVRSCGYSGWNRDGSCDASHTVENSDDNNPNVKISFGATSEYLHGDALKTGQFSVSFGALEIYLDQAQLDPSGAELYLNCSFGAIKLYVPKTWRVVDRLRANLGGVKDDPRMNKPGEGSPQLLLTGNISFGGVEVYYV